MKIYNTLTKKIDILEPLNGNNIKFFVCGPTVYDNAHIGHAKTYIQMDLLARTLKANGYKLDYIQNITDIDDKIIKRAKEQSINWQELSNKYLDKYLDDMAKLGNVNVNKYIKATDRIQEIIKQVEGLINKGFAYEIEDGIYFDVSKKADYGKLSGRVSVKEDDAQSRIDESKNKRGWNDFCLWKFSKPGEPKWDAPFGNGRPGWHIEDTAISESEFGSQYDIHGGAIDLIFPHHEAEIAQMESLSGQIPFVKYWVHAGFLKINSKKMSKSLENFVTIESLIKEGFDPLSIRLLMLQSHYRSELDFDLDKLVRAEDKLTQFRAFADLRWQYNHQNNAIDFKTYYDDILSALNDDLSSPRAIAILNRVIDKTADGINANQREDFEQFLSNIDNLLGLNLLSSNDIDTPVKSLIQKREKARENKDWQTSDLLRDELKSQGIGINDSSIGSIWYRLN